MVGLSQINIHNSLYIQYTSMQLYIHTCGSDSWVVNTQKSLVYLSELSLTLESSERLGTEPY